MNTPNITPPHFISYRQGIRSLATSATEGVPCAVSHMQMISATKTISESKQKALPQDLLPTVEVSAISTDSYEQSNDNPEPINLSSSAGLELENTNEPVPDLMIPDLHPPHQQDAEIIELITDILESVPKSSVCSIP